MCSRRLGGRGGGDAKTIISPNTSFGDIIIKNPVIIQFDYIIVFTKPQCVYHDMVNIIMVIDSLYFKIKKLPGR